MAEFNTSEGEIGVYAMHIPMTVILKPGVVTLTENNGQKKAALHTGFAEILPDRITILAEEAERPSEIDIARAQAARERAEARIREHKADTDIARAETALQSVDSGQLRNSLRQLMTELRQGWNFML